MNTLNKDIQKLTNLLEQSQNKKLLWEEMQIISQKAFELQDKIMDELDEIEATETDVTKLQATFSARESIWDIMTKIAERELEMKEKTHHKETQEEREKRHKEIMAEVAEEEHHCCCGHHHGGCCKKHKHDEECHCHQEKPKRKCCCRKKKEA